MRKLTRAEELRPEVASLRAKVEAQNAASLEILRERFGVWINFVAPVRWQGRKVWAIGSRVYTDGPPLQTFHEFLFSVLQSTLGEEWRAEQAERDDRHFVLRCFDEYYAWLEERAETNDPANGIWATVPNGWAQYLRSLAWDVATLTHACPGELPDDLVDRLRASVAFQSARYEIAVAAIFARLDCEIEFLDADPDLKGQKRAEFIATHRPTGHRIAVEAKSRRRQGVINEPGKHNEDEPLRGDARAVRRLFVKALDKEITDLPFLIFIDINAPVDPTARGFDRGWRKGIKDWMDRFDPPTPDRPERYNGLYVTNFSPHYDGDDLASSGEWLCVLPVYVENQLEFDLTGMLSHALDRHDLVPEIGEGGKILD